MLREYIPSETELPSLKKSADCLRRANGALAEAKKLVDAAKEEIAQWVKEKRGLDIAGLPIGDIIIIKGVVMIELSKMDKFDEKAFLLEHGDLHAKFKRPLPVTKYKSLV